LNDTISSAAASPATAFSAAADKNIAAQITCNTKTLAIDRITFPMNKNELETAHLERNRGKCLAGGPSLLKILDRDNETSNGFQAFLKHDIGEWKIVADTT
jgi:hypothetical protein